ncbi:unnamed protein product [Calicophoron daubneyi]
MWPDWLDGLKKYKTWIVKGKNSRNYEYGEPRLKGRKKLRILLYIGAFSKENSPGWETGIALGAPLGELVQWSDLMAGLFLLGHDISVHREPDSLRLHLNKIHCTPDEWNTYTCADLIFTDIVGYKQLVRHNIRFSKCKYRILDSYGTESEFNQRPGGFSGLNLNLQQFYVFLPHSPDNTFLGFVVEEYKGAPGHQYSESSKPVALVYGKEASHWHEKIPLYLKLLSEFFDIHANLPGTVPSNIPHFVQIHNYRYGKDYLSLMKAAKVFVGLGRPYESTAALEAIANGVVFLNVRFDPPHNRYRTEPLKDKPTSRDIKCQHPYIEDYIGEPYSYVVDMDDPTQIRETVKRILSHPVSVGYRTFEFTTTGYLERINALLEHQNFCNHIDSTLGKNVSHTVGSGRPTSTLPVRVVLAETGVSCSVACANLRRRQPKLVRNPLRGMDQKNEFPHNLWTGYLYNRYKESLPKTKVHDWHSLHCAPQYFEFINNKASFIKSLNGASCSEAVISHRAAPYWDVKNNICFVQGDPLGYDCVRSGRENDTFRRLCPCRDALPGQTALSECCL